MYEMDARERQFLVSRVSAAASPIFVFKDPDVFAKPPGTPAKGLGAPPAQILTWLAVESRPTVEPVSVMRGMLMGFV